MRKHLFAVVATAALIGLAPVRADVNVQLPDNIKDTFKSMQVLLDQCVGEAINKTETAACQQLHALLFQLANQPTTPVAGATPSPTPSPSPTPDAPKTDGASGPHKK